jgi:hypothetical protein
MELGFQAGIARIEQYVQNGYNGAPGDTITNLNAYYAQDQNWQNNVSYWSGIPKNQQLDPNNPTQMAALAYGILKAENVNNPALNTPEGQALQAQAQAHAASPTSLKGDAVLNSIQKFLNFTAPIPGSVPVLPSNSFSPTTVPPPSSQLRSPQNGSLSPIPGVVTGSDLGFSSGPNASNSNLPSQTQPLSPDANGVTAPPNSPQPIDNGVTPPVNFSAIPSNAFGDPVGALMQGIEVPGPGIGFDGGSFLPAPALLPDLDIPENSGGPATLNIPETPSFGALSGLAGEIGAIIGAVISASAQESASNEEQAAAVADAAALNDNSDDDSNSDAFAPVVLDLSGKGINITPLTSSNMFVDLAGNGFENRTAWAGAGNAVLFFDPNNTNEITNPDQVIFTDWDPTATTDLQALEDVFDTNHDGSLDAGDADFSQFKLMVTNANGTTSVETLAQAGITSINLTANYVTQTFTDGSSIDGETTFTTTSGTTGTAATVTFATDPNGFAVENTTTVNADGSTTIDNKAFNADGSLANETISTISADGLSKTIDFDDSGNGIIDHVQTDNTVLNADGSTTETLSDFNGAGVLEDSTVTTTSADGGAEAQLPGNPSVIYCWHSANPLRAMESRQRRVNSLGLWYYRPRPLADDDLHRRRVEPRRRARRARVAPHQTDLCADVRDFHRARAER